MTTTLTAPRTTTTGAGPRRSGTWALREVRWAAAATVLFLAGLTTHLVGSPAVVSWTLFLACYVAGGWEPGWAGLTALRQRRLDVDLLMVLAAIGAASIGQVLDGALLIVIFATSGALEAIATKRTADSVGSLLDLAPETATRLTDRGEETVDAADLRVGDVILVRPGERIGGDGQVVAGAGAVDQASITGESMPADKEVGDEVFAGTLNGTGALTVRVTRPAAETVIARIVAQVAAASATKAKVQLFIEKVEQRYSTAMVAATLALVAVPLILGAAFQPTLLRAMTFMIVASPCAVVLATMPPLLSAIANAGRHGVLVKSAVVLERLATVDRVAFDKTGTLTTGTPRLTDVRLLAGATVDETRLLQLAAAAESPSEHPLARAIVDAAPRPLPPHDAFASTPGVGVTARVDGHHVAVARPTYRDRAAVAEIENAGRTAVVVHLDHRPAAVLGLADQLRPGAAETVARLGAANTVLLTGDNARTAGRIAAQVGITDVRAGLLPADKVDAVRALRYRTLVVGDGVNDAPALATAHVGVAMGHTGSDLTLDTADAVITRDDLTALPTVIALARRARRLVAANLVIAATVIAVLVAWDLIGTLPLPLGVAGHEGSTILVALNGLRLLRKAAWRRAAKSGSAPS
ncbi:heavy metal translocating P-type ATPase [Asanoa iriomotensis]|uniref:Metal-transporting ATPase n=1 Tax=Asanoa iriomotensis TaxID=234613 RepID=A0ABQ4BVP3_9ACTN|nr:heavy metal translocating P-type ATPase [Asanoa iriomotensis]GIF54569.1 metal-transporting ATPase [Asanoa iriomotensis]